MRSSGILMHISSLPSPYGIGSFGKSAFDFIDFLKNSGQEFWQVLPMGPTGYGDSPYQSFSTFAGNPYFIDMDTLAEEGLIDKDSLNDYDWFWSKDHVDYGRMYNAKFAALRVAYNNFMANPDDAFADFCTAEEQWLDDYAMYMAINTETKKSWHEWDDGLKLRKRRALAKYRKENQEEIVFWKFMQYEFFKQWNKVKSYANENGIRIIGDLPIYVSDNGSDVWANPGLFDMNKDLSLRQVSGVPPDAFSEDGQLWGNPVYKWKAHKKTGYDWWNRRMQAALKMYDVVRIDHFRGFESFFSIDADAKTAKNGKWVAGPGIDLFEKLNMVQTGDFRIIAEDLGVITPPVRKLVNDCGYPGMKILHFAFGIDADTMDNEYLPHNINKNSIVYTGTHDNNTTMGWWKSESKHTRELCLEYGAWESDDDISDKLISMAFSSRAKLAVIPMQDWLDLGDEGRMNTPSTSNGNWGWRLTENDLTDRLAERILRKTRLYNRCPKKVPVVVEETTEAAETEEQEKETVSEE
ncbi:MAG: 4-alpha-glucanotransferase [Oscillospiraceae bacterium]|nr:4-alpha-glucanotransferase [Oscillospiraceae bacterium]